MKSSKEKLNQDSGSTRWSLGSALTSTEEKGKVATDFEAKEEKQQRAERRKFAKDSKAKTSKVFSKKAKFAGVTEAKKEEKKQQRPRQSAST